MVEKPKEVTEKIQTSQSVVSAPEVSYKAKKEEKSTAQPVMETPQNSRRRSSALSLNAALKKEDISEEKQTVSSEALPKNPFSEFDFQVYWKKYIEILEKQGEKMLASILNSTEPIIKETQVSLTYPNAMMMEEVRKNQFPILNYLREKLQNYEINFVLQYNEDEEKSFVYTPQEKFEKLLEINPLLGEFRKKFDLDI